MTKTEKVCREGMSVFYELGTNPTVPCTRVFNNEDAVRWTGMGCALSPEKEKDEDPESVRQQVASRLRLQVKKKKMSPDQEGLKYRNVKKRGNRAPFFKCSENQIGHPSWEGEEVSQRG